VRTVDFDTGYAGPNGTEPQSWVNGNGTSYIYFGSGQFDGQGSGHDFNGTVSVLSHDPSDTGHWCGGSLLPGLLQDPLDPSQECALCERLQRRQIYSLFAWRGCTCEPGSCTRNRIGSCGASICLHGCLSKYSTRATWMPLGERAHPSVLAPPAWF